MADPKNLVGEADVAVLDEIAASQKNTTDHGRSFGSSTNRRSDEAYVGASKAPGGYTGLFPWDPRPGFAHIDGDINGLGYNETSVDIVCVPCPGADPVETWARDPLPDGYFERSGGDVPLTAVKELAGATILSPTINRHLPKAAHLWVRQGIRKEVNEARVLLYRHREMIEGLTLDDLARDLIEQVWNVRDGKQRSRPLFFVAHSIGGLVVELALIKATQNPHYKPFMYNCHGITFFATPHRGSSYLSKNNLKDSIQRLLHLQRPLPRSISNELRLGHKPLLKMHDDFATIASELRIWSFYETIDSQLSGSGSKSRGTTKEVRFGAPIASIKSSLVDVRQERVFSLDSNHFDCASFGEGNTETMNTYLKELAAAVKKATELSSQHIHTPLRLKEHVKVEIIGFYDDPDAEIDSDIRLYFTKPHLQEFLEKGPQRCLEERLRKTTLPMRSDPDLPQNIQDDLQRSSTGMGMMHGHEELHQASRNTEFTSERLPRTSDSESQGSPPVVVTRSPMSGSSNSMPAEMVRRMASLTVPALSTPSFSRPSSQSSNPESTKSDPTDFELSPKTAGWGHVDEIAVEKSESGPFFRHQDQLSRAPALADSTAGFSRPNPLARKFMWIHTPFTNPSWVKDIFSVIANPHDPSFAKLFNYDNWTSKHVIGRHSQSQASFVKSACNFIPAGSAPSPHPSPHPSPNLSGRVSPGIGPSSSYFYLYLPFLNFDRYIDILQRRRFILRRMQHGRARPVPRDVADLDSAELRMIWEYIGYDPPLNYRRTLDQFDYPSLRDTWARDDDQMLYKLTKDESVRIDDHQSMNWNQTQTTGSSWTPAGKLTPSSTGLLEEEANDSDDVEEDLEKVIKDGKVLMVDQLWLWAIDAKTLTTFFSKRESKPKEGPLFQQADLRNSVYNELNGDLTGRCENALDLAAFIVLHAITVLLDRTSHPDLEIFRIFEEAISMLTERMTSSLKRFRMQTFKDVGADSDESNRPESIKKRHRRELQEAERENRENTSALMELRDMEDELRSIQRLFESQEVVVNNMKTILGSDDFKEITHNGVLYLEEALRKLDEYKTQTMEMLKRVDTTRNDYEKLLEMVQRQAQVDEVRWSRLQTELASSQNLSVMIFTTFTVIFLPLSFFTSLFGMNTVEWEAQLPSIGFIGAISLPLSIFLIVAALVGAFSTRVQGWVRSGYRGGKTVFMFMWLGVKKVVPEEKRVKRRKRIDREEKEEMKTRIRDRGYDFWATVRKERGSEYRIPEVNRNRAGTGTRGL